MVLKFLSNWRCGALYLQGNTYDFGKLPDGSFQPHQDLLDQIVSEGIAELIKPNSDTQVSDPIEVLPLIGTSPELITPPVQPVTPPTTPPTTSKGKKET